MRFAIRRDTWWVPLLAVFGATRGASYIEVDDRTIHVRFGFFSRRLPRARVVGAGRVRGSWWYGIGWHTDFVDALILNGSLAGLVELRLDPPERLWLLFVPVRCRRLLISLEQPEAFLQALGVGAGVPTR